MLERIRAKPAFGFAESITAVRRAAASLGKVARRNGILAIRWRLPSGVEIDTRISALATATGYEGWLEPYGEQEEVV